MNSRWWSLRPMARIDPGKVDPRLIDAALVLGCLALTALAVKTPWASSSGPLIAGSGIAGSIAIGLRKRWPVAVSVITAGTMALSGNPGPLLIALYSASTSIPRRRYPALAGIGVAGWVAPEWIDAGRFDGNTFQSAVFATALVLAVGLYQQSRQQLVASLRERADQADAERLRRDEQARAGERTRIAREMHDVLAHKVSLISLHAGGLEVNSTAEPSRIEQGAALIRVTAQEALEELRTILGLLRTEDAPADDPETFADLDRLVESWTAAGAVVRLHDETAELPAVLARTVYRLVQEGLTNAHRHAPGSEVTVSVTGGHGHAVTVLITNRPSRESALPTTGSGVGLVGLTERIRLIGGTLRSAPDPVGGWRVEGQLPWPAGRHQQRPLDSSGGIARDQGSVGGR